jgi:DNA polymerase V
MQIQSTLPPNITLYRSEDASELALPIACNGISCGFPSPAEDYIEQSIDLNKLLIKDKEATFFGRVKGNSMLDANIHDGDVLIIDKSLNPCNGCIALCMLNGEFTVKRMEIQGQQVTLYPANPKYKPIQVSPDMDFLVWGIVTYAIHKTR